MERRLKTIRRLLANPALQHLIFWGLSFYLLLQLFRGPGQVKVIDLIYTFVFHVSLVAAVYLNLSLLIPKLLQRGNYVAFIILFLVILFGSVQLHFLIFDYAVDRIFPGYYFISDYSFGEVLEFHLAYMILTSLLKLSKGWFRLLESQKQLSDMSREKVENELKALKAQIDPHFLFNSLNNAYSLAVEGSSRTPEIILYLSDIYRYMIYDAVEEKVPLSNELEYLEKYLEIQRVRSDHPESISFKVSGNPGDIKIAPLLFLPLVENAFKHGARDKPGRNFVSVSITIEGKGLLLIVENDIPGDKHTKSNEKAGFGLENVKRRLELEYPGKHKFEIKRSERIYKVELNIDCSEG